MKMYGIDISMHNVGLDLSKIKADFVIIKASEGVGYFDPAFKDFFRQAKLLKKRIGLYHYARNDNPANNAVAEAESFLSITKDSLNGCIPILDFEEKVSDVLWAKGWLDHVYTKTGIKPMIYMSEYPAQTHDWSMVAKEYELWVAKYRDNEPDYNYDMRTAGNQPSTPYWKNIAMWQYTSAGYLDGWNKRLDCNVFYGDEKVWDSYAGNNETLEQPHKPETKTFKVTKKLNAYYTAEDAKLHRDVRGIVHEGTYYIFNELNGFLNVTKTMGEPGSWIDPNEDIKSENINMGKGKYVIGTKITTTTLWTQENGGVKYHKSQLLHGAGTYIIDKVNRSAKHPYRVTYRGEIMGFTTDEAIDQESTIPS